MAQATANPFDSLDDMSATLAETDDLLSQMAGKEVDRLLADSQADSAQPAPPVADVAPPPEVAEQSMSASAGRIVHRAAESRGAIEPGCAATRHGQ